MQRRPSRRSPASSRAASRSLDELGPLVDRLPAAAQDQVKRSLEMSKTNLQTQVDRVLEIPGVSDILKPILDTIVSKLAALLQA